MNSMKKYFLLENTFNFSRLMILSHKRRNLSNSTCGTISLQNISQAINKNKKGIREISPLSNNIGISEYHQNSSHISFDSSQSAAKFTTVWTNLPKQSYVKTERQFAKDQDIIICRIVRPENFSILILHRTTKILFQSEFEKVETI